MCMVRFRVETLYYQIAILNSKDPTTAEDRGKLFFINLTANISKNLGHFNKILVLVPIYLLSTWVGTDMSKHRPNRKH
jgi:hypothetical protein